MVPLKKILIASVWVSYFGFVTFSAAWAETISDKLEVIELSNIGSAFSTVTLENTYTSAVVVCTPMYNRANSTSYRIPVIRVTGITATSFQIRAQRFSRWNDVNQIQLPARATCLIAEAGEHTLGPLQLGAGTRPVNGATHATNRPMDFSSFTHFDTSRSFSIVGAVQSNTTYVPSTVAFNDCENLANPAFNSGWTDGACVSRLTDKNASPANKTAWETIGYIVFTTGSGLFSTSEGIFSFDGQIGGRDIAGVLNGARYSYATSRQLEYAVASQNSGHGNNETVVGLQGASPLAGKEISLMLDESASRDRVHTTEKVAFLGFAKLDLDVSKTVDQETLADLSNLEYTMSISNISAVPEAVSVTNVSDIVSQGATTQDMTANLVGPRGDTNQNARLDVGETWDYTLSYHVDAFEFDDGQDISNTVTFDIEGVELSDTASTILTQVNEIEIIKTAKLNGVLVTDTTNARAGDTITYDYTVKNIGNTTAKIETISDNHETAAGTVTIQPALVVLNNTSGQSQDTNPTDMVIDRLYPNDTAVYEWSYEVTVEDIQSLQ